jgi:hypothetical protein
MTDLTSATFLRVGDSLVALSYRNQLLSFFWNDMSQTLILFLVKRNIYSAFHKADSSSIIAELFLDAPHALPPLGVFENVI